MTLFTITRSGFVPRMITGDHFCGLRETQENKYTVSIKVSGQLEPPDFFLVENSLIHTWIVNHFSNEGTSRSCERMALEITSCVLDRMAEYPQWIVEKIHSEVTGSNAAKIAHEWIRDTPQITSGDPVPTNDPTIDPEIARIINGYWRANLSSGRKVL